MSVAAGCDGSGGGGDGGAGGAGGAGGSESVSSGTPVAGSGSAGSGGGASSGGGSASSASASAGSGGGASSGSASSASSGSGGAASTSTSGGGTPTGACPPNATFCSGFEDAGLPEGATYRPSYQADQAANNMVIDTATFRAGASSLHVKPGGSGYDWRMLSVETPGPTFWVRLYMRSSVDIGQSGHNAYFQAMTGDGEPNAGDNVEIAEQFCQILLNQRDDLVLSEGATAMCGSGTKLPKDTWHCMEAYFDGPQGNVQVYANGDKIIDKTGWKKFDFKTFSFGYLGFHGPARSMWYDDVAVASERIGCAP
ncbi:hypothetical protein WMF28_12485 [Sorangium sp. So ce590]|uniref:hypothetical protein n=1 Tax=Sorangium sp. So ce590 TaxID=3133317 RepID=UPI003F5FCDE9